MRKPNSTPGPENTNHADNDDYRYILECKGLKQYFPVGQSIFNMFRGKEQEYVQAVDDVDLQIETGEIVGIAGESGCGKTTLGKTIIHLIDSTDGSIHFKGEDVTDISGSELQQFRRNVQIIFQDPFESLNPRLKIFDTIKEPLSIHGIGDEEERYNRVIQALERAELEPAEEFIDQYPHQLSGGEKQRVAIARALVLEPEFILCDEPVSMLDVSVRAGVLNLLEHLNEEYGITLLFISHDLSLLRQVSDRIGIMYLGRIIEMGETEKVIQNPTHPYSKALLAAAPEPDPFRAREHTEIQGSIPDPINLPKGCRFKDRCPERQAICDHINPPLLEIESEKQVACHPYYDPEDRRRMEEKYESEVESDVDPRMQVDLETDS